MKNAPSLRAVRRLNDPNVVVLPTAPDRQVKQHYNRTAFAERKKVREAAPWPSDRYVSPGMRKAKKRAVILQEMKQSPELVVLVAILDTIPREQRQSMIENLALRAVVSPIYRQALEIIRSTTLNFGESWDLMRALDEIGATPGDVA